MDRPIKLFAYKVGEKLHLDVDVIMSWPLSKIYEYMAFYLTEDKDFQERVKDENMTTEERTQRMLQVLGGK